MIKRIKKQQFKKKDVKMRFERNNPIKNYVEESMQLLIHQNLDK